MANENKYQYDFVLDKDTVAQEETSHTLILRQIKEGTRVLECGPGGGIMTRYLKEELNCNVTILEIDRKLFKKAMQYAEAGLCVNLEKDDWMSKLEDESFDYILYADVLEHLHDPVKVLKKMQRFLKQNGRVILSVPNVAHGDIIMNLLQDQFTYMPLGLLDNTHVHLFAYESLHTMIKEAGYYTAYETCVTVPLFHSEQSQFLAGGNKKNLSQALLSHPTRYAYQFICTLSKDRCEMDSDVILRNQRMGEQDGLISSLQRTFQATCFYDMGTGYSPKNREVLTYTESSHIELSFQVPAGVRRIRFDPIDGHCCILRGLEVFSNQGIHKCRNLNGATVDNLEIFYTTDPQLEIEFTLCPAYLNIRTDLIITEDPMMFSMMSSCMSIDKTKTELEAEVTEMKNQLTKSSEALAQQQEEAEAEKQNLQQTISSREEAMENLRQESERVQAGLKEQLAASEETIARIRMEAEVEKRRLEEQLAASDETISRISAEAEAEKTRLIEQLSFSEEAELRSREQLEAEQCRFTEELAAVQGAMTALQTEAESEQARLQEALTLSEEKASKANAEKAAISKNVTALRADLAKKNADLTHYITHYNAAIKQREQLKVQVSHWRDSYNVIANSASWKATKPVRATLDTLKKIPIFKLLEKGLKCWKDNGFRYTCNKVLDKMFPRRLLRLEAKKELLSSKELAAQHAHIFPQKVKISIVVPVCNTREAFLRGMIQSVLNQTYTDWELCLADVSDAVHQGVERICREYEAKDNRISYRRLKMDFGPAGNINAALRMAKGKYVGILNHDDQLHPAALYEVMCAICEKNADFIYTDENAFHVMVDDAFRPHFKPDFAPDSLRGYNYIGRFFVFSAHVFQKAGPVNVDYRHAWEYDLVLRLTEKAEKIVHVPKILYYSHVHPETASLEAAASGEEAVKETCCVLDEHLRRVGLKGKAEGIDVENVYRIRYEIQGTPLISILIPNYEHKFDLKICIDSIYAISTYTNFEIVIVENNSKSQEIFDYYQQLQQEHDNLMVVRWDGPFNYSAICNFGARYCSGEYLLLLNNDIEVISSDWMQEMLMFAQRPDVGAVGAKLYFPDNTIQHAGVCIGIHGSADHLHKGADRNADGYMGRLKYAQDLSAVTAACMLLRRGVWDELGGLDEEFTVAFNDVDFCLRIRDKRYLIVWTPFAELYHYESKSRGYETTPEKRKRFEAEKSRLKTRWKDVLETGDPYYNPNFSLDRPDFYYKPKASSSQLKPAGGTPKNNSLELIRNSEYFDAEWYLANNIDFQGKIVDLPLHYLKYGGFELRDPSRAFCSEEYYYLNEDVRKANVNPLLHYEMHGKWENRDLYGFEESALIFPEGACATEREFTAAPVLHRRTIILSSFFADGKVSDTLLYLIHGLREVADQIIIVGDCLIFPEELDKLDGLVVYAKFERHYQYDFGSYKRGMAYAREHGYLDKAVTDELIFINDSCYGPVYPFAESFDPMTKKNIDFWGYVILKSAYKNHISTYFLDFKRSVIDSMLLDEFLERVHGVYDRGRVIATLETELTQYLHDHGLRYEAIANTTKISFFNHPVTLLKKYRVPLVKKKAFTRRGLEDQLEALEIIKENAPELAAMIHYKPYVPKKHHFPTEQEHLENCRKLCRRIGNRSAKGGKIKALFLVFNATFFPSKPLYMAMLKDRLFDPYIAVIPDRRWGVDEILPGMDRCYEALLEENISAQRIIRAEKDELDRWSDVCIGMDIVCYNSPYNLSFYRYLPRYAVGRAFLPIMVNYGFYRSKYDDKLLAMNNYEYLWKAFFECEETLAQYRRNSTIEGVNGDLVGYIKMDPLSTVPCEEHERKRILVALHHSVEGGNNKDLELGNMLRYSDYFLNLPGRYPEIDFVYRPHPHLFQLLTERKIWSEEKVEQYIAALKSKPNVIWSNGQDYFKEFAESDGCIQDCGSFLVEYFYTGKPCCYMLKDPGDIEGKFVELGKKCLEQCYISYDTDAIDSFIENVIIAGNDEKAEGRAALAKEIMVNYPHAAEAALESIKKAIFDADKDLDQEHGIEAERVSAVETEQETLSDSGHSAVSTSASDPAQKDETEHVQKNEENGAATSGSNEMRSARSNSKKSKRNRRR